MPHWPRRGKNPFPTHTAYPFQPVLPSTTHTCAKPLYSSHNQGVSHSLNPYQFFCSDVSRFQFSVFVYTVTLMGRWSEYPIWYSQRPVARFLNRRKAFGSPSSVSIFAGR